MESGTAITKREPNSKVVGKKLVFEAQCQYSLGFGGSSETKTLQKPGFLRVAEAKTLQKQGFLMRRGVS